MKSHAKSQSAPLRLRPRLAFLVATAAAFLLVPAAQALAEHGGPHLTVDVFGFEEGGGTVTSENESLPPGEPPINCTLPEGEEEGVPPEGSCENEMPEPGPGEFGEVLTAIPGPNSEFLFWEIKSGFSFPGFCPEEGNEARCWIFSAGEDAEVVAYFACEEGKECVTGPTPEWDLTVGKSGSGEGWIHSDPAGINCGLPCTTKTASFEEGTVTLKASGAQFDEWEVCPGTVQGAQGRECVVDLTEDKEAVAKFSAPAFNSLTVTKTGTGEGWIHSDPEDGPGTINCGLLCTVKSAEFEGEVTLKASGAQFTGWVECPEGTVNGRFCEGIPMTSNKTATAEFTAP